MGSHPSKTTPEAVLHEKAVLERLRSLSIEEDVAEEDFVHIGNEKGIDARASRHAEDLPVKLSTLWQSKVLADPKNRSANTPLAPYVLLLWTFQV